MAQRRDWNALSSAYRSRLLSSGITREAYEGGAKLSAARGHKHTPEHPQDVIGSAKYSKYQGELARIQQRVWQRKQELFDNTLWWKEGQARKWLEGQQPGKVPGIRIMKQFMAMTDEEIYEKTSAAGKDLTGGHGLEDDWYFLLYH